MGSSRIVLLRHAHTAGNGPGASTPMAGRTDLPLSPRGRVELREFGGRFPGEAYSIVYSSPLVRAMETARAVRDEIRPHPGLAEISCGLVDGWPIARVQRELPSAWAANLRQEDDDFRWPGGESYRELRARVHTTIREIAACHVGETILAVTHAGVIGQVVGTILGTRAACWSAHRPENLSLTEIVVEGESWRLIRFGELLTAPSRSADAGVGPTHDP